jgi:DNA-binding NarL/FixJ family response regulator
MLNNTAGSTKSASTDFCARLAKMVATAASGLQLNEHMQGHGPSAFEEACKLGLEGIVSKRKDSVLDVVAKAGAGFRSLKDTWADTTTPHGRLMLIVLGGLAEFERELIRARTGEGRKRAKARGVKFGRPPKLTPHQRQEALQRLAAGETQADIARTYNVNATTIGRLEPRPFERANVADQPNVAA